MTFPTDPLELTVFLYKKLNDAHVEGSRDIEGTVPSNLSYSEVMHQLELRELLISEDPGARRVEFSAPVNFFRSLDLLLEAPSRRISALDCFYLQDLDYYHRGSKDLLDSCSEAVPESVRHYFLAVELFQALRKIADHEHSLGESVVLVFLHSRKLEITAEYDASDLTTLNGFQEFRDEFFESTTHAQQKASIVKNVLIEAFQGYARVRLADVLGRFETIASNAFSGYELYVSEFSFQKIKSQIEQEKFELTAKLNKVFSDIQNQLLAIPAALVLVGGQMERTGNWSVKNLFIWLGAVVFSKLMDLLISNQRHTLDAIKREIDQQWELIEGRHRGVASRFKESYEDLRKRYKHQVNLLRTVSAVVATALVLSTAMLIWYSLP
jgi:hypothetical protein